MNAGGWMTVTRQDDLITHVIPIADLREHQKSQECWCRPVVDEEERALLIHNSADGREDFEVGRRKPS